MTEAALSSRQRLVEAAVLLFRSKGYNGVGIAEILAASGVTKGSLYHHFPTGKADLAAAAAETASTQILGVIDRAFADAGTVEDGMTTLCHRIAKVFDLSGRTDGCPVSAILFDVPANEEFRQRADRIFETWIAMVANHLVALGHDKSDAKARAEFFLIAIEGAWTLARARGSSAVLRRLPKRLF